MRYFKLNDDGHITEYDGEDDGYTPKKPQEESSMSDSHIDDYEGEKDGCIPDLPRNEPNMTGGKSDDNSDTDFKERKKILDKVKAAVKIAYNKHKKIHDFSSIDNSQIKDSQKEFITDLKNWREDDCYIFGYDFSDAPSDHPLQDSGLDAQDDAFRYLEKFSQDLYKELGKLKLDNDKFDITVSSDGKDGYINLRAAEDKYFSDKEYVLQPSGNYWTDPKDLETSTFKFEGNDPEDYKGEEDGLKPDPAEFPKDAPQHEDVAKDEDIKDTEPEDDPLVPEVSPGATESPTGAYVPEDEPIPGFFKYMQASMEDDEELTILTIPAPTKEEGDATPEPHIRDVDDKDPHDPEQVDIVIDIEQNRDDERQMALVRRRREILRHLDGVELYLKNYNRGYIGQEGFITNFVTGVVNVVGHILNLFNAGVLQGWRNFKRGELTAYSDSNRATMTRLYFADFYRIAELQVDTPQGMEGPYAPALNSLCAYLTELNMLDRAVKMLKTVECVERDMHKQSSSFTSTVVDATKSFTDPKLEKLFKDTSKFFTSKKSDGGKFSELFASMKDYETVIKQAIDEDSHLRQVASVHSRLEDIQKVTNRIADDAELLTKPQLEDLAKVARAMAETFDNYGTVIADIIRVQHNLTEVTKKIRKALAM